MKEEYAELMEMIFDPLLYSMPEASDIIKKKSLEFFSQKEKGLTYSREKLLEEGMEKLGEVIEYFVDVSTKKGFLGKILAKKASSYFAKSLMGTMFSSESNE